MGFVQAGYGKYTYALPQGGVTKQFHGVSFNFHNPGTYL